MTFAFIEGFDDYPADMDAPGIGVNATWPSASTLGALAAGRFGYQSLQKSLGYTATRGFDLSAQVVMGLAFLTDNFNNSDEWGATFAEFLAENGNIEAGIGYDKVGQLFLTVTTRGSAANPPARIGPLPRKIINNTWHYLEFIYDAGSRKTQVYLDGEMIFDGAFGLGAGVPMNRIRLRSAGGNTTMRFDDMYLCINTVARIGEARAQLLLVTADEAVQWTPKTAGPNVDMVKEQRVDLDTTYNESNTPGQQDLFTLENLPGIPRKVFAVQLTMASKKSDSATRIIRQLAKIEGQIYPSPPEYQSANYTWRRHIMEQSPDATPWTPEKVNAMSIGYRIQE